ncbi:nucleotidyltransferase domain-containing protein [Streptomyces sp. NPDC001941]|uniref:nucleotidyltransferase family protein n=1 Tax=Streptomyces sp. NPDC001941 TaxID=3154659 RepID=UPI00332CC0DA
MTTTVRAPELPTAVRDVVDGLAALPGVRSVRIAGSRARGRPTGPDSDWDVLVYADGVPPRAQLRRLAGAGPGDPFDVETANGGHPFEETEFSVPASPRIDVCLRPLAHLTQERARAARGAFALYAYPKTAGGVPSYLLLAEAALSAPVAGDVEAPGCPGVLVDAAVPWWRGRASCALLLALDHLRAGERVGALEHVLAAAASVAHARLIGRGDWYPITKRFLDEAAALPPPARERLAGLSPAGLTEAEVRGLAGDLGVEVEDGLDWLARGEHLGPGGAGGG